MSTRAADDFAEIRRNRIRLMRICYRKLDLPVSECWCMKAGPDGADIPCSEARDPTPWERVELGKPDAASELKTPDVVLSHIGDCAVWTGRDCDCGSTVRMPECVELGKPGAASELEPGPTSLRRIQVYGCDFGKPGAASDLVIVMGVNERGSYRWRALEEGEMLEVVGAPK